MSQHPYIVTLKEPGTKRPYLLHTVASTEAGALRIARKHHRGWHVVSIEKEAT